MIAITPALLYHSGLSPIPTVYDPSSPPLVRGDSGERTRPGRAARGPQVDDGGRRLGSRDVDDEDLDGEGDDKELLPAYERRSKGLPGYNDVLVMALSEGLRRVRGEEAEGSAGDEESREMQAFEMIEALSSSEEPDWPYVSVESLGIE